MRISSLLLFLLLPYTLLAQHDIAPNGYYPPAYTGDTFTGIVVSTDPAIDTVTLQYTTKLHPESLSVNLNGGCSVPSRTGQPMHANSIPPGTVMTAFYMTQTQKHDGKKERTYVAIGISFVEWHGKKLSEENRQKLYYCGTHDGYQNFRVWNR
jgi:hypothetical protein